MTFPPKYKVCCGIMGKRRTAALLFQKRKNASLPLREAGAVQHIGTIEGDKAE